MATARAATARRDRSALWVFGAAVLVRLLYFATTNGASFRDPLIDADYYDYLGVRIASGEGFEEGPFWQPPLYPLILGALYGALGHDFLWPRLLQAMLDGLSAVLALRIARKLTGNLRFGVFAGLAVALHGPMVFYSGELLPTTAAAFCGMVALSLAFHERKRWEHAVLCGASVGAGALFVAPVLVLIAPLSWFIGKKRGHFTVLALSTTALIVGSATLANWVRASEFVPISANGGINLYIGNHAEMDRMVAVRPGAEWEELAREPAQKGIDSLAGHDAYFVRAAAAACTSDPLACVGRLFWKTRQLLMSRDIPRNESLDVAKRDSWLLGILAARAGPVAFPYVVLLPLAVAGGVVAFRRRGRLGRELVISTLCLAAVPVVFFVTGRYRVQFAPELAVLAALGAQKLWQEWADRRREALAALFVLVLGVWPVQLPIDEVPFEAEMYYVIGGRRARLRDDPGAVKAWEKAVSLRPGYLEAGFNLGLAFERLGEPMAAANAYRDVLRFHPNHAATLQRLHGVESAAPR
jgi:4-amino-4-deoxy-L-arabinose transferase-like glycosyltransferase